ncbi:hypothetical protein OG21DRAFT_1522007 [Imleria badia]|nr:hypothetical protein OG21DRAFT_1522007 [Imleria badia]
MDVKELEVTRRSEELEERSAYCLHVGRISAEPVGRTQDFIGGVPETKSGAQMYAFAGRATAGAQTKSGTQTESSGGGKKKNLLQYWGSRGQFLSRTLSRDIESQRSLKFSGRQVEQLENIDALTMEEKDQAAAVAPPLGPDVALAKQKNATLDIGWESAGSWSRVP